MRRLNRKRALSLVRELDAFPKVPESYVETSALGGAGEHKCCLYVIFIYDIYGQNDGVTPVFQGLNYGPLLPVKS